MTNRHFLLLCWFTILVIWRAEAQFTPQGFNYQCIVRDGTGSSLNNQTVSLLFTIRTGSPNGPVSYSEKQNVSTNEFGLVNLVIGQGTPLQGAFNTINWGGGAKFLTVSIETAPNVFDELGSTQLMSVPYAMYAQNTANSGDDWGAQVVQVDPVLSGNGTSGAPLKIAQQNAQAGQVLKWNGSAWTPQNDEKNPGTLTEIQTGAGLAGGPITSFGTISLAPTSVTPGPYGSPTQIPVLTVDSMGRITEVHTVVPQPSTVGITGATGINVQQNGVNFTITNTGDTDPNDDLTTSSQANGDVSGPFANLQIKANAVSGPEIADNGVGASEIADGAVGTNKISDNAVNSSKIADGAVGASELANASVTAVKINDMGATSGQVLKWTGTAWAPAADNLGSITITAGNGINVTGSSPTFTINNTGDINPGDDITNSSIANGDVTGPFSNIQIKPDVIGATELTSNAVTTPKINAGAVTGDKIAQMSAGNGEVLKWNGTTWTPAADNTGSITITGGIGIDVIGGGTNFVIANNGDVNPFDDVLTSTVANGDVTGTYDNLQIKQSIVTSFELASNAVTTVKIQNGAVAGDKIAQMGAVTGQVLKWNGTSWAPAIDNVGSGGDDWGSQVVVTGPSLSGSGIPASPLIIAQQGAANGQVLKWNGTAWLPANDNNSGGDNWGTQVAITNPTIAGDGTGGNPLRMAQQGASNGQVLKWNGVLWAPADDNAGADNWGTQTVVTNSTLQGNGTAGNALGLAQQGAGTGQVLKWNGSSWAPADDNNTGDDWGGQTAVTNPTIAGDGTPGNPLRIAQQDAEVGQVLKWDGILWEEADDTWGVQVIQSTPEFQGNGLISTPLKLAQQGAATGQVLKWNGASWSPADDLFGAGGGGINYLAGPGISITGTAPNLTISNTGDLDNTNEIQTISLAGNQLNLSKGGGSVNLPPGNSYSAGTGINITGAAPNFTIVNTGDLDNSPTNEIQTLSFAGGALTLSNGGGTVNIPNANTYSAGTGIGITGTAPNFTIVNTGDLDNNPANELQNLSLNGSLLTISGTNSSVHLDTVLANSGIGLWSGNATNIYNTNSGNVGIGTTTPIRRLHVKGDGELVRVEGANPLIGLVNGTGNYDGFLSLGDKYLTLGTADSSSIVLATGGGKAFVADGTTANVGIGGLSSDNARMKVYHSDITGGFMLENSTSGGNWEFRVDAFNGNLVLFNSALGAVPAGAFSTLGVYTPSDRRLKKDINNLPDVLDKIMQLKPVTYRYKQQAPNALTSIGFIAQDIQMQFPELVSENLSRDGKKYLSLNYAGFSVLALKAIQEQEHAIESLQQENSKLQERLNALESRLLLFEQQHGGAGKK